mgnify:CR=1 FL=1
MSRRICIPKSIASPSGQAANSAVFYQTARTDLLDFEGPGVLEKLKKGNAFVFHAISNLERQLEAVSQRKGLANAR